MRRQALNGYGIFLSRRIVELKDFMFINEQEANRRLNSSENVLTVIHEDNAGRSGVPHETEPLVIVPSEIIPAEDEDCASASGIVSTPSSSFLKSLLGMPQGGRKKGLTNMDPAMRAACAVTAQLVDTRTAAAAFDTSYHHADELKHGFTSQQERYGGNDPDAALQKEINRQKRDVRNLAFEKLTKSLGLMTDDKLAAMTDPVKIARVARDLSTIHDKAMPKEERSDVGGVHFHIWKPEMKDESSYERVTVGG